MQITRDNHYVPQWYQRSFLPSQGSKLCYLDLSPEQRTLPDGRVITLKALHHKPPSKCFYQTDLYTTFFGSEINDEIERKLFGQIDDEGSRAVRAFLSGDASQWHSHFQSLFSYLDTQKLRTPKGLDWLKGHYPSLEQNLLMREMQGIRNMHCTLWSEGAREIVSAKNSAVKLIISDHPVTVYNYACPPDHPLCSYPGDPTIALKGSQTLFPLDNEHCLILTNLEYAEGPSSSDPLERRTFARNFRPSMVRTDKFIQTRELDEAQVTQINYVLKSRARRFIAAEEVAWLYPERDVQGDWLDIRRTLLPPNDELWQFGGELFVRYEDGSVHYQDAYGRTKPKSSHLAKSVDETALRANDECGCGSGKKYKNCCKNKPKDLRPTWSELSIRERNIGLFNGITRVLGLDAGKDWTDVRRELNEEQVRKIHELYAYLWPTDTDIFSLLPKPDGTCRALYTGLLDPRTTPPVAINASLYFGEVIVQSPFIHHESVKKDFSPVEHPAQYKLQTLKSVMLFMQLMPAIEAGHINLVPDPGQLDNYQQWQMMHMAEERSAASTISSRDIELSRRLQEEDFQGTLAMLPRASQESMIRQNDPTASQEAMDGILQHLARMKEDNPLILLQDDVFGDGEDSGQMTMLQMGPNFEMALLVAQATGSYLLTDSHHRWSEFMGAQHRELRISAQRLPKLSAALAAKRISFLTDLQKSLELRQLGQLSAFRTFVASVFRALGDDNDDRSQERLIGLLNSAHDRATRQLGKTKSHKHLVDLKLLCPLGGIYHNNV
ncbi:MAG: DUF4238 domain-containing protein [Erythrobacter sp.]|nr:DUF4238 domain-containing protein [Erythrobacter sp.]